MPTREPMPPAKAFWNALVVTQLPVLAMSAFVVYFLKPESRELSDFLGILAVVFGVPGVILCAVLYRAYRRPPRPEEMTPRKRFSLGATYIICAVAIVVGALAPLANHRPVDRWATWSSLAMALLFFVLGVQDLHRAGVFRRHSAQADLDGPSIQN